MKISDYELQQERVSYSYYTVRHFKKLYPQDRLYFLAGGDMLSSFTEWFQWREILSMAALACIAREQEEYMESKDV